MELQRGSVHGEKLIEMEMEDDNVKRTPKKKGKGRKEMKRRERRRKTVKTRHGRVTVGGGMKKRNDKKTDKNCEVVSTGGNKYTGERGKWNGTHSSQSEKR